VIKLVSRWNRSSFSSWASNATSAAYFLITPKTLGGLGFPSMQALTTTITTSQFSEGVGMLRSAARIWRADVRIVRKILNQDLLMQTPISFLRDPKRIRRKDPVLVENRIINAILRVLESKKDKLVAKWRVLLSVDVVQHANSIAEVFVREPRVNFLVVENTWKMTPLFYVERMLAKFKRADTILGMISRSDLNRLRLANINDVKLIMNMWSDLI
jgi:hypothetical protein